VIFTHMEGDERCRLELQRNGDTYRVLNEGKEIVTVDARGVAPDRWSILLGSRSFEAKVSREKTTYRVEIDGRIFSFDLTDPARAMARHGSAAVHGPGRIAAPMPGRVVRLLAEIGQEVQRGDGVVVVEAMKMENELAAPRDGVITEIAVEEGQTVEGGATLAVIGDPPAKDDA
jgi:3-methylcrotonyl-CoA carboxylase alpha subunit